MSAKTKELAEATGFMTVAAHENDGTLGLLTRTGSRAYGTHHEQSDHDFRGVYIASLERFCSLQGAKGTMVDDDPFDTTIYELGHFARLAAKGNPTALEVLWGDEYMASAAGEQLRSMRSAFLSKRIVHTYGGYAMSQLGKAQKGTGGSRGADHYKRRKFRLHTLRLLRVGQHALATGNVMVQLPDEEVRVIKAQAELPLEEFAVVAKLSHQMFEYTAKRSPLPDEPHTASINRLLYDLRRAA